MTAAERRTALTGAGGAALLAGPTVPAGEPRMPRTGAPGMTPAGTAQGAPALSGRQKAAVLVRLLLSEGVDLPLDQLPDAAQAELAAEIGRMAIVDRGTVRAVVEEFLTRLDAVGLTFPAGVEDTLSLLDGRISGAAADRLRQAAGHAAGDPWAQVAVLPADRIVPLVAEECAEIAAVILSKLPVARAAEVLGLLPGDRARRIAYAVSRTGTVAPATVARIGAALAAGLADAPERAFAAEPPERVGAILNLAASAARQSLLDGLDETDADFAGAVRQRIFTFADIPRRVAARDVPKLVRAADQSALVTALAATLADPAGKDAAAAEFILANMSQRMAATLREEAEARRPPGEKDSDAAHAAVVGTIRDLEAEGEMTLLSEAPA